MKCPHCHAENQDGLYCAKCGKPLDESVSDLTRVMPPLEDLHPVDEANDAHDIDAPSATTEETDTAEENPAATVASSDTDSDDAAADTPQESSDDDASDEPSDDTSTEDATAPTEEAPSDEDTDDTP